MAGKKRCQHHGGRNKAPACRLVPGGMDVVHEGYNRYRDAMRAAIRMGLVTGWPSRLGPGETRITRARKEIARMQAEDKALARATETGEVETNAAAWDRLHTRSLAVMEAILQRDIPLTNRNLPLVKAQQEAAQKVITLSARITIERFRAQSPAALARFLERVQAIDAEEEGLIDVTEAG